MNLKIVIVGAASYTFGPSMLKQALWDHRLAGIELALVDVNRQGVDVMAALAGRMSDDLGLHNKVTAHTQVQEALAGANFVIYSVAVEGFRRFGMDVEAIAAHAPGHLVTEFGGIAGISYSLRQIALVEKLVEHMRRLCPDAWLLDTANPMPRLAQAAHELGVRTAGFCAVSIAVLGMLWRLLKGGEIRYPYTEAAEEWQYATAGLNHFAWLLELSNRRTGEDLLGEVRQKIGSGAGTGEARADEMCRQSGYLLLPGDDHTRDFLEPTPGTVPCTVPFHGNAQERQAVMARLGQAAGGEIPWDFVTARSCWERPIDFIAGLALGQPVDMAALDLVNAGQIPNLPRTAFVETPCYVDSQGPRPRVMPLPDSVLPYARSAADVTDRIVQAALRRSKRRLHEAVELDPTVTDKKAGLGAIDACLTAHADLLPAYSED